MPGMCFFKLLAQFRDFSPFFEQHRKLASLKPPLLRQPGVKKLHGLVVLHLVVGGCLCLGDCGIAWYPKT